ncbi:hypothetical protein ACI77O_12295 [Pseudomonas tritici]|uniref:hypothetical protein n=1 Tax=Pseudomonas tritici TaxID=2745518 RepID=UPI00387B89D8
MADEQYSIWVVYDHPIEYPDKFVGRRWEVKPEHGPTEDILLADSVDALRQQLPAGLIRLPRNVADNPSIVETWI